MSHCCLERTAQVFLSPGEKCTSSEFFSLKFYPLRTAWKCKGNSRQEKILFSSLLVCGQSYLYWITPYGFISGSPILWCPVPPCSTSPGMQMCVKGTTRILTSLSRVSSNLVWNELFLITKDLAILLKDNFYQPQSLCSDNGLNTKNVKRPFGVWQTRAGTLNDACCECHTTSNRAGDAEGDRKPTFTLQCGLAQISERSVQC